MLVADVDLDAEDAAEITDNAGVPQVLPIHWVALLRVRLSSITMVKKLYAFLVVRRLYVLDT
jgi:hypothetical protein